MPFRWEENSSPASPFHKTHQTADLRFYKKRPSAHTALKVLSITEDCLHRAFAVMTMQARCRMASELLPFGILILSYLSPLVNIFCPNFKVYPRDLYTCTILNFGFVQIKQAKTPLEKMQAKELRGRRLLNLFYKFSASCARGERRRRRLRRESILA